LHVAKHKQNPSATPFFSDFLRRNPNSAVQKMLPELRYDPVCGAKLRGSVTVLAAQQRPMKAFC
jgi:hypothetical protein